MNPVQLVLNPNQIEWTTSPFSGVNVALPWSWYKRAIVQYDKKWKGEYFQFDDNNKLC